VIARAALLALLVAGCALPPSTPPGTFPGDANGAVTFHAATVESESVSTAGAPTTRTGQLFIVRAGGGQFVDLTRFGTLSGVELGFGIGGLRGDVTSIDDMAETSKAFYFDAELGGVIQPLYTRVGSLRLALAGDFGLGFSVDDRYGYAGARVFTGAMSRKIAFDAGFRRRFGETPGNPDAHEDRARAILTIRYGKGRRRSFHAGVEVIRGDQRSLDSTGAERPRDDYLLRGRYEMASIVIGFGTAAPPPWTGSSEDRY
jgi:hypothetical protein